LYDTGADLAYEVVDTGFDSISSKEGARTYHHLEFPGLRLVCGEAGDYDYPYQQPSRLVAGKSATNALLHCVVSGAAHGSPNIYSHLQVGTSNAPATHLPRSSAEGSVAYSRLRLLAIKGDTASRRSSLGEPSGYNGMDPIVMHRNPLYPCRGSVG